MLEKPLVLLPRHGPGREIPLHGEDQAKLPAFALPLLNAAQIQPSAMKDSSVQGRSSLHALKHQCPRPAFTQTWMKTLPRFPRMQNPINE